MTQITTIIWPRQGGKKKLNRCASTQDYCCLCQKLYLSIKNKQFCFFITANLLPTFVQFAVDVFGKFLWGFHIGWVNIQGSAVGPAGISQLHGVFTDVQDVPPEVLNLGIFHQVKLAYRHTDGKTWQRSNFWHFKLTLTLFSLINKAGKERSSPISLLRIFSSLLPTGSMTFRKGWKSRRSHSLRVSS